MALGVFLWKKNYECCNMAIPYEDLNDDDFELLTYRICTHILGIATEAFAKGPDGGRDARFEGCPLQFQSWNGKVIVQAKHVNAPNASFSAKDFYSLSENSLIRKETKKVKKLRSSGKLDYYILFANRRKTPTASEKIRDYISKEAGIPSQNIVLYGLVELNEFCRKFPDVLEGLFFPNFGAPLQASPDEIEIVIDELCNFISLHDIKIKKVKIQRVPFKEKNEVNGLAEEQARWIYMNSADQDKAIRDFLSFPGNENYARKYAEAANELQGKVLEYIKEPDYDFFKLFKRLLESLFEHSEQLKGMKPLTKALLGYMYFNCDLGLKDK